MRLSTQVVTNLRPREKSYWVSDSALPGFRVKVTPDGTKSFAVRLRTRGGRKNRKDTTQSIGRFGLLTVDQARTRARELLSQTTLGVDVAAARRADRTALSVSDLAARFLDERKGKLKPRTVAEYGRLFKTEILPAVGSVAAAHLSRRDVARLHHERASRPYLANRCVTLVAALLNWGERHGYLADGGARPTRGIELFPERGRERVLTDGELLKLGEALSTAAAKGIAPDPKRAEYSRQRHKTKRPKVPKPQPANPFALAAVRLLLLSGFREQEALTLKWSMVDLDGRRVDLPDTKTGRSFRDLGGAAVEVLRAVPRIQGSPYVFPGQAPDRPLSDIKHVWHAVRFRAGLEDVRLHDLRHTFASTGATMGVPLLTLGAVLGHSEVDTTKRYAHLGARPAAQAADEISRSLATALAGESRSVLSFKRARTAARRHN